MSIQETKRIDFKFSSRDSGQFHSKMFLRDHSVPVHSEQTGCDFNPKGIYSPVGDEDTGDKVITT